MMMGMRAFMVSSGLITAIADTPTAAFAVPYAAPITAKCTFQRNRKVCQERTAEHHRRRDAEKAEQRRQLIAFGSRYHLAFDALPQTITFLFSPRSFNFCDDFVRKTFRRLLF